MLDNPIAPEAHPCARLGALLEPVAAPDLSGEPRPVAVDPAVLAVAGRYHLVPALASALARRGVRPDEPELAAYLDAMHALNARRNARLMAEAGDIAAALVAAGVRPLFLKGTALLLLGLHADPASRFLGDIDILVPPDQIEAAAGAIAALGFACVSSAPAHVHDRVKLAHPDRPAAVELHHPAVPGHLAGPLGADAMRAAARPVAALPGASVPSATDLVLHNVLHGMLHDWNFAMAELPLRDALDLALVGRAGGVDWNAVAARIERAPQGAAALAFALAATREALPWCDLPELPVSGASARALRAWRDRRGAPTGRVRRRLANVAEHSGRAWRGLNRALHGAGVLA
ncbi:MAG: nucleotidyltransferase family protein [Amaricoccus sp.]|uniref:nucleotidyltransferase family protein n=1 Tax=Amaricoccus sp. TaxID=1872485 RepID=UPI0039E513A5